MHKNFGVKMNNMMKIVFSLFILSCISCSNEDENISQPITTGNITGYVNLYDEGVTKIDNSNMTIKVEGITPAISATTEANGHFILSNVPYGTHTLVYEKSGFGTFKKFNIEHPNAGSSTIIAETPSLGQTSTTSITNLTVSSSSNFPVIIGATTNPEGNQANTRYIRFFFSTDPNVSSDNYESVLETFQVNISPYNLNLSQASLDVLDFPSGTAIYVKCYGESFWGNNYFDPNLGRDIFPNLNQNSASAVSFIAP